jgi:hypothetical protein
MYIIYESVASNDPRVVPEIEYVGSVWHYTIAYIAPANEEDVFTKWLKPSVVSQDVAKAYKLVGATNGEISLRVAIDLNGDGIIDEIEQASAQGEKIPYFLTEADDQNTCELLKTVMKNYIDKNSTDSAVTTRLYEIIDSAENLDQTHMVMATYFDFDVASTAGKEKIKEVEVPWSTL